MRSLETSNWNAILFASLLFLPAVATSQDSDDKKEEPNESDQRRAYMEKISDYVRISAAGEKHDIPKVKTPLFRYNSPSREYQDGTIWAWSEGGRPLVLMEIFTLNAKNRVWIYGGVLTSDQLIEAHFKDEKVWYPKDKGMAFQPIPETAEPSKSPIARLRRMKQFSRRFSGHQFWNPNNSRYELRLIVQPVHRYTDPERGVLDGAVFLMVHEIEPEIVIQIEATKDQWQFSVARIGSAEFHIQLDDETVFQVDRAYRSRGKIDENYHSWVRRLEAVAE